MGDGVHLDEAALDNVMNHVVQKVEESFVARKEGRWRKPARRSREPDLQAMEDIVAEKVAGEVTEEGGEEADPLPTSNPLSS